MQIRYTNTLEDGIAFNRYLFLNSKILNKQKARATICSEKTTYAQESVGKV